MKVKRLELKGFRGFDEIVLDFDTTPQRPTVFIGNNGVGKSTVLSSLVILLSWLIKRIEYGCNDRYNLSSIEEIIQKTFWDNPLSQGIYFNNSDFKNGAINIFGKITIDCQFEEVEVSWGLGNFPPIPEGRQSSATNLILYAPNVDLLDRFIIDFCETTVYPSQSIPIIVYYPVNRSVNKVSLESQDIVSTKPIDAYKNTLGEEGIDFETFSRWFRNTEDLEGERIRDDAKYQDKQLVAVRNAIHTLIPEFDDLRVRRKPLKMTVNKNGQELIINQLSDGEKCLLAMVGDIARRLAIANPSLDDPLQGEGIVLIDEIELHLHPQWQHKIIPRLTETFPNCQFIVTTHSPQVLSHVQPENIYILQSTPDGIIASHPESSYGRDSNQILEDYMGTPERPQDIKDKILKIFQVIDQNDLGQAKNLCESLGSEIGSDEPELIRARAVIKRKEILGK